MAGGDQIIPPPVCVAVLNHKSRDGFVDYAHGPRKYVPGTHPPINYHAYAAATRGAFFDKATDVIEQKDRFDAVLVLIRSRTWVTLDAVKQLKEAGMKVLVSWKESGPYQITKQLSSSTKALQGYQEILMLADGILSPTRVTPPRWGWISSEEFWRKTRFVPTPYPLEYPEWDFSVPLNERKGLMVGTREFFTPTQNHLRALARSATLAGQLKIPVTVVNADGRKGRELLRNLEESFPEASLHIIEGKLPYDQYLKLISSHRVVFQLDRSVVPGQVAGDALLARTLCAGGNSAIEEEAFPDFCDGRTADLQAVYKKIADVFQDDAIYEHEVKMTQRLAFETVSYGAVADRLKKFIDELDV